MPSTCVRVAPPAPHSPAGISPTALRPDSRQSNACARVCMCMCVRVCICASPSVHQHACVPHSCPQCPPSWMSAAAGGRLRTTCMLRGCGAVSGGERSQNQVVSMTARTRAHTHTLTHTHTHTLSLSLTFLSSAEFLNSSSVSCSCGVTNAGTPRFRMPHFWCAIFVSVWPRMAVCSYPAQAVVVGIL